MGNSLRKYKRLKEKEKQDEIRGLYGKKPKGECPICHKKSLFYTNNKNEVFCIRCNEIVRINKN